MVMVRNTVLAAIKSNMETEPTQKAVRSAAKTVAEELSRSSSDSSKSEDDSSYIGSVADNVTDRNMDNKRKRAVIQKRTLLDDEDEDLISEGEPGKTGQLSHQ